MNLIGESYEIHKIQVLMLLAIAELNFDGQTKKKKIHMTLFNGII